MWLGVNVLASLRLRIPSYKTEILLPTLTVCEGLSTVSGYHGILISNLSLSVMFGSLLAESLGSKNKAKRLLLWAVLMQVSPWPIFTGN